VWFVRRRRAARVPSAVIADDQEPLPPEGDDIAGERARADRLLALQVLQVLAVALDHLHLQRLKPNLASVSDAQQARGPGAALATATAGHVDGVGKDRLVQLAAGPQRGDVAIVGVAVR